MGAKSIRLLVFLSILVTINCYAKEKIALVIGNADYTSSALVNSVNDAEDIASTLENLEFSVTLVKNARQDVMESAISKFVDNLNDDTVGLFYYSGHAVQYKGSNYLIPIGSVDKIDYVEDLPKNTVNTSTILDGLNQSQSNLNFVFLDACRDNPFKNLSKEITPGLAKTSVGARNTSTNLIMKDLSVTRGVSETHEQVKDTKGILVAYSTMPGSVASDGSGRNSPYTKSLLKHITKTNSLAQIMLSDVQQDVEKGTSGKQAPIFVSAITGRFCFNETNNGCGKAVVNIHSSYLKGVKSIQKLTLADGSSYEGQVVDDKPHGKGVQVHKDGGIYEGKWFNGKSNGYGSFHDPNVGHTYTGEWKDDIQNGLGVFISEKYGRLEGFFIDGGLNGKGVRVWPSGARYEGNFKNNKEHGKGKYTWSDGDYMSGEWVEGERPKNGYIAQFINGISYEGYGKNGKRSGRGVEKWANGNSYDGFYLDNVFDGFGVFTWKSGDRYEGQWKNGEKINGIYTWTKGDRYEGDWDNDVINGNGIYYFSNGSIHTGGWKNSKRHGMGVTKELDGTLVEANYKNGYPDGKIKITMTNDWIIVFDLTLTDELKKLYDKEMMESNAQLLVNLIDGEVSAITPEFIAKGNLKNGQRNGKGDVTWKDGSSYKGDFLNDMAHGKGVRVEADGGRYKGNWFQDKRDGFGIQDYANGDRYLGHWKKGEFNGKGVAYFANGSRYEGMFYNHKKNGKGMYLYTDGSKYEGEWKEGKKNGKGLFIWKSGNYYDGSWLNGKTHGNGTFIWSDGNIYKGEWKNGSQDGRGEFSVKDDDPSKAGKYVGEFKSDVRHGFGIMTWENGDRYEGGWKNNKYHGNGLATTSDGYRYEGEWSEGKKVDK